MEHLTQPSPEPSSSIHAHDIESRLNWYHACDAVAAELEQRVPPPYRSRTFSGLIGDIKALSPRKALSLYARKKGMGLQYAAEYLRTGIDHGRGYQACAATALHAVLESRRHSPIGGQVLDVGCAVGVTAGVLGLEQVVGFDLFGDLLHAAQGIDSLTGAGHRYVTADMTNGWPFACIFDTVVCGLVCHHLKTQETVAQFFRSANRVLKPGGSLIITLPAGSVATTTDLQVILSGLASFGFDHDPALTGLIRSDDDPHALFWMFLICATKRSDPYEGPFVDQTFSFASLRTPVPRTVKGDRARQTVQQSRQIHHDRFRLICEDMLRARLSAEQSMVFETVCEL